MASQTMFVNVILWVLCLVPITKGVATNSDKIYFAPASSNDFKKTPIIELTQSNMGYVLPSQTCNIVFTTNYDKSPPGTVKNLKHVAKKIAGAFRRDGNVLVSHIGFDNTNTENDNDINKNLRKSNITIVLYPKYTSKPKFFLFRKKIIKPNAILKWVKSICTQAKTNRFDEEQNLSVIFKTNKTLAILANGFDVSKDMVLWVKKYCKQYPLTQQIDKITVLDARNTTLKEFLCLHAFAGRPLILKNAVNNWPAMKNWKPNGPWVKSIGTAKLSADIGVERGWIGTNLLPKEYLTYMSENENERRADRSKGVKPPPWSSIYAYTHQHTKLNAGDPHHPDNNENENSGTNAQVTPKFVADVMWKDFKAPKLFNQQNWFRYMGQCHKMMTVTFWATEGARQSNHQDDFGSSKWQAQIYGRKKWIMHPPEESHKLYNGLVDPFEPDYKRYPLYRDVKRVEFVLEEGDVLFWSAGWWHATLALENSLAVAQNILNEHNYMEFRRTSRKACKPDGSHGIYSPWCACFRRTYGKWDSLYQNWLDDIKNMIGRNAEEQIENYKFEKFSEDVNKFTRVENIEDNDDDDEATQHSHPHLINSISHVLETVNNDIEHFHTHDSFPIDTARGNKNDFDYSWEL
jgi:hypothetical protein